MYVCMYGYIYIYIDSSRSPATKSWPVFAIKYPKHTNYIHGRFALYTRIYYTFLQYNLNYILYLQDISHIHLIYLRVLYKPYISRAYTYVRMHGNSALSVVAAAIVLYYVCEKKSQPEHTIIAHYGHCIYARILYRRGFSQLYTTSYLYIILARSLGQVLYYTIFSTRICII